MITEELGRTLINSQHELKGLKSHLDSISYPKKSSASVDDDNAFYGKVQNQLYKFEENIDKKIDNLVNYIIGTNDLTVQKLPEIRPKDDKRPSSFSGEKTAFPKKSHQMSKIEETFAKRDFESKQEDARQKPLGQMFYKKKSRKTLKRSLKLQSDKIVKNGTPIELPRLNESDLNLGIMNLINRGILNKDANLNMFIEKGAPLLLNKPAKYYPANEKFNKGEILSLKEEVPGMRVDLKPPPIRSSELISSKKDKKVTEKTLKLSFSSIDDIQSMGSKSTNVKRHNSEIDEVRLEKANAKAYPEVVDAYSLHRFIIRKGKALEETPEFQSYKRIYYHIWEKIRQLIKSLEKLTQDYDIKLAYIDGKKLAELATDGNKIGLVELIECISNQDENNDFIKKIPGMMYKGPRGRENAATKIQAFWRMFRTMRNYLRMRILIQKIIVIQKSFRVHLKHKETLNKIKEKSNQQFEKYKERLEAFKENWNELKFRRRVEIHINSFNFDELRRLSMEKYTQRQNIQITRIFALRDPLIEVIYIVPFDLSNEIISYYNKILELSNIPYFKERIQFVWPENHLNFPSHFTTSRLLLYSPKSLKRLTRLIKGKTAYIVPGYPSNDDIKLASHLGVPMMMGEPQKSLVMSMKSSAKRLFSACDIPAPPGAYEIYDEKEFINSLTVLIANNLAIDNWIFKIDDEFNGRGIATISLLDMKPMKALRKFKPEVDESLLSAIKEILIHFLPKKIRIATPSLYSNYQEYINMFTFKGGVIEAIPNTKQTKLASPSIFFMIEPSGGINILGAYDKISGRDYVNVSCIYPQQSLPSINLEAICEAIGKSLYEKGVFGYTTLDLIAFPDPLSPGGHPLFWGIGLDCYLNNYSAAYFYFDFLMKGRVDSITGTYVVDLNNKTEISIGMDDQDNLANSASRIQNSLPNKRKATKTPIKEERYFLYTPFISHPGLSSIQYKTFFHMCRIELISFDLERKIGSTFLLIDALQTGVIGLMTIGESRKDVLKFMNNALNFLVRQAGSLAINFNEKGDISRSDKINLVDIISKIRLLHKNLEKNANGGIPYREDNKALVSFR